jgi:hypothetical protein
MKFILKSSGLLSNIPRRSVRQKIQDQKLRALFGSVTNRETIISYDPSSPSINHPVLDIFRLMRRAQTQERSGRGIKNALPDRDR